MTPSNCDGCLKELVTDGYTIGSGMMRGSTLCDACIDRLVDQAAMANEAEAAADATKDARLRAIDGAIATAERRGELSGMRRAIDLIAAIDRTDHATEALIELRQELATMTRQGGYECDRWPLLVTARARLIEGEWEYGDRSFEGPLAKTIDEIEEEAADIIGWAAVLGRKIDRLRKATTKLETWNKTEDKP